jgi:PadR family transcriptional regulator
VCLVLGAGGGTGFGRVGESRSRQNIVAASCKASMSIDRGGHERRFQPTLVFDRLMERGQYSIRMSNKGPRTDVLQGTLDLMVLQTVAAIGPMHGYAIAARLEQVSGGALRLNMGTLYPGLMRLEQRGWLRAAWGVTDTNRKARYYTITAAGRRQLAAEKADWERMTAIMHVLLHGEG